MKLSVQANGSAFSVPVSEEEKSRVKKTRDRFENILANMANVEKFINVFFDHSNGLDVNMDMSTLSPLISKYKTKLKVKFNNLMLEIGDCLDEYGVGFVDTRLDNIKDLIIENATDMRQGAIELLRELGKVDDPQFLKNASERFSILDQTIKQMSHIVRNELFRHIDRNILGKVRIGNSHMPLVIRGE